MAVSTESKLEVNHNGLKIQFDEKGHIYKVFDREQKLKSKPISVTTLIHKYQKPFDVEAMSLKCARKEGVTQDEIKARWKKINRTACNYGTKMHSVAERIFNGEFVDESTFSPQEQVVYRQITQVVDKMRGKPFDWESEKIIFDPGINVAGTVDLIGRNKDNGEYVMVDWKTNKRIRMDNEYGDTFLAPIDELPDCEFNLYGLQLSLYEKILRDAGFIDKDAPMKKFICHFHCDDGCHFHEIKPEKFNAPTDKLVKDWTKKQEAIKQMNIDIPQF